MHSSIVPVIANHKRAKLFLGGERDEHEVRLQASGSSWVPVVQASEESKLKQASSSRSPSPSRSSRGATHPQAREGKQAPGCVILQGASASDELSCFAALLVCSLCSAADRCRRDRAQATGALASSTTARSNRSLRIADKQSREKQALQSSG